MATLRFGAQGVPIAGGRLNSQCGENSRPLLEAGAGSGSVREQKLTLEAGEAAECTAGAEGF